MYEKFAELLASTGVKAADVARATGIIPTTFSDWKKGKSQPKIEKLQKIADYFNVQLEYFTEGAVKEGSRSPLELSPQEWELVRLYRSVPAEQQALAADLTRAVFSCIS